MEGEYWIFLQVKIILRKVEKQCGHIDIYIHALRDKLSTMSLAELAGKFQGFFASQLKKWFRFFTF